MRFLCLLTILCINGLVVSAQVSVDTLQIYFKQGQSQWDADYMDNQWRFVPYVQKVTHFNGDSIYSVNKVEFISGASPEGGRQINERLSQERVECISELLRGYIYFNDSIMTTQSLNEDWLGLAQLVRGSGMPHEVEVLVLLENTPDINDVSSSNALKNKLRLMHDGKVWQYMYTHFFPSLRGVRVLVYYEVVSRDLPTEAPPVFVEAEVRNTIIEYPTEAPISISVPEVETRFFAAKTNLLFLAGTIANLGFEMELGRKWSIDIPVYYSPYDLSSDRKIRVLATQPELRRWLTKAGEGHFFGLHGHLAGFNIAINDHGRYQDPERPLWGFGLGYGFALNFGRAKNWGMEFNIGVGFANYEYEAFYNRPNGQIFETGEDWYWGVTRAGITLTYKWWVPRKVSAKKAIIEQ